MADPDLGVVTWRRAIARETCGYCGGHTQAGDPVLEFGRGIRCKACARARLGELVPIPFPEREVHAPAVFERRQSWAPASDLVQAYDAKQRQVGEDG